MGISKSKLLETIGIIAPESFAEAWDNCGIQVDMGKDQIEKILICLEITKAIVEEAKNFGYDFIITHHPLIFGGIHKVDNNDVTGNYTIQMIKEGISVYSAHTSFDKARGGNNDYLAELLDLSNVCDLGGDKKEEPAIARMGEIKQRISFEEFGQVTSNVLNLPLNKLRGTGDRKKMIKKVGLCTGSGGDLIGEALSCGCDLFLTGEVRHHEAVWAKDAGLCLLEAGHYGTEKIFAENFAQKLKKGLGADVEIDVAKAQEDPIFCFE